MSKNELQKTPNVNTGLDDRICKAVRAATTLNGLFMLTKTKRYTMARIRRIILSAFLGITKNDLKNPPSYVRILGMNGRGKEILSAAKCELPINTSISQLSKTSEAAARQAGLEARCGDQYALALEKRLVCGTDYTAKPIIID